MWTAMIINDNHDPAKRKKYLVVTFYFTNSSRIRVWLSIPLHLPQWISLRCGQGVRLRFEDLLSCPSAGQEAPWCEDQHRGFRPPPVSPSTKTQREDRGVRGVKIWKWSLVGMSPCSAGQSGRGEVAEKGRHGPMGRWAMGAMGSIRRSFQLKSRLLQGLQLTEA